MLYDEPVLYFKGLTIFKDFSDPKTFYFLPPEAPRIARSAEGGESGDHALRLVLYRPDPNLPPPPGMEDGGGFLNLDADLHVNEAVLQAVRDEIRSKFGAEANLVPVPFRDGSVELVLLGVNRDEPGQPFVRKVAGTTVPSLYGSQRAAFSTVLDRHGAAVMKSVIEAGGVTMAMVIYHLTYAGIGPAYNLKITIDYKRVFNHLDLRLRAGVSATGGRSSFVAKGGFHLLMEELKEKRAILVEEVDPVPGEGGKTPTNQEAINEIIGNLMGSKWFKPTLTHQGSLAELPAAPAGSGATGSGTTGTGTTGTGTAGTGTTAPAQEGDRKSATWTEEASTPTPLPADRGVEAFQPAASGTRETLTIRGSGATAKAGPNAESLQTIAIEGNKVQVDVPAGRKQIIEIRWPAVAGTPGGTTAGTRKAATFTPGATEGPAQGRGVEPFQASATGNSETLVIKGEGATARVGATPAALAAATIQPGNRLTVDVGDGETRHVEITWPAAPGSEETFHLLFDYDRPDEKNDDTSTYRNRRPNPAEPAAALKGEQARFLEDSRSPTSSRRGPAALDDWLATLQPGSSLTLHAHSSYERDDSKRDLNQKLAQRRMDVAVALIGGRFPTTPFVRGHDDSKSNPSAIPTLPNDDDRHAPPNSRGGRQQHRVVLIKGTKAGTAQTVFRGQLHRDPAGGSGTGPGPGTPESTLRGRLERPESGKKKDGENATSIQASFEINLEMIQQEEQLLATYELNTRKARLQPVHPQGQLVLDAPDRTKYIIEADGAIDFFQKLVVAVSTTAQWALDGIQSISVQIRYAKRGDGSFQRTGEVHLTPDSDKGSWQTGVLHENADPGRAVVYGYEYKVVVNYTQDVALGTQQGAMTSVGVRGADAEGWIPSDARNLVIHPRDVTPAVTVNVATGILHYDLLQMVQLVVAYGPYRQNITLSADDPEHRFVVRPEPGIDGVLQTSGTLFYKDGARVPLPPTQWQPQELVVINEPRENMLRVQAILADPAGEYQRVESRFRYEHDNRVVELPIVLEAHAQTEDFAVRLEDPAHRAWQYQATLIKKSGDIDTIPWTEGTNDRVIFGVQAVDVIPVQVNWLVPLAGSNLLAVKVDLVYEDAANGVRWEKSELIRQGHSGTFDWTIPIKDAKRRTYRYRVTEFGQNGRPREAPFEETDSQMLVLLPLG